MFWAEKGSFAIPYVAETLCYDLPAKQVRLSLAVGVSVGEEDALVGAVHRRHVLAEPSLEPWYRYLSTGQDPLVDMFKGLYGESFEISKDLEVSLKDVASDKDIGKYRLAPRETGFNVIAPSRCYEGSEGQYLDARGRAAPFTPIVFGPLEKRKNWLYSFDLTIQGRTFDLLVGTGKRCSVDGASVLARRVIHEDLLGYDTGDPWYRFFTETVCNRVVKPTRYDVMIVNNVGKLPSCYRLCARVQRQLVQDADWCRKVAWFSSDDPDQDFIVDLAFDQPGPDKITVYAAPEPDKAK
jgi:hypothetical protein